MSQASSVKVFCEAEPHTIDFIRLHHILNIFTKSFSPLKHSRMRNVNFVSCFNFNSLKLRLTAIAFKRACGEEAKINTHERRASTHRNYSCTQYMWMLNFVDEYLIEVRKEIIHEMNVWHYSVTI